jgi:DNA-directed RNA polymerase specialized sigma24 family protein
MASFDNSNVAFQITRWSMVLAAHEADSPASQEALSQLCETYWYPVYAFIRRRGHEPEPAKDLTQEFFSRLIAKKYLRVADRERGRFRTFLLACVDHFLSNERKKERALKRGGHCTFLPIEQASAEEWYQAEPVDEMSPDKLLDRRWALTLMRLSFEKLRQEYVSSGKAALFELLQGCLSGANEPPATFAEIGTQLGLSEAAARQAAFRMRSRFGEVLREGVAQTVAGPVELDAELRHLRAAVNGR